MMNKALRIISLFLVLVISIAIASSCIKEELPSEEEVITAAKDLVERAVEVNRIFFWEGLPHVDPPDDAISMGDADYLELTEEYMYLSEYDLSEKAATVYSEEYCKNIDIIAFEGVKASDDKALFARYIVEKGIMKINRKLSEEGLKERLPDADSVTIEKLKPRMAVVKVTFECEGKTETQSVTIVKEKNGWRLDTPTY